MSRYSEAIEKHFLSPRNAGRLEAPDGVGNAFNEACGDELRIFLCLSDGGRVEAISFEARACSAVIAAASIASEAVSGASLDEARSLDVGAAVDALGGLPRQRAHAPRVVERALSEALDAAAARRA